MSKREYTPSAYNPAYNEDTDDEEEDEGCKDDTTSTSKYQPIKIKEEDYDVETDDSDEELGAMIYRPSHTERNLQRRLRESRRNCRFHHPNHPLHQIPNSNERNLNHLPLQNVLVVYVPLMNVPILL